MESTKARHAVKMTLISLAVALLAAVLVAALAVGSPSAAFFIVFAVLMIVLVLLPAL